MISSFRKCHLNSCLFEKLEKAVKANHPFYRFVQRVYKYNCRAILRFKHFNVYILYNFFVERTKRSADGKQKKGREVVCST